MSKKKSEGDVKPPESEQEPTGPNPSEAGDVQEPGPTPPPPLPPIPPAPPTDPVIVAAGIPALKEGLVFRCTACGSPAVHRIVLMQVHFDAAGTIAGASRNRSADDDLIKCQRCQASPTYARLGTHVVVAAECKFSLQPSGPGSGYKVFQTVRGKNLPVDGVIYPKETATAVAKAMAAAYGGEFQETK